MTIEEVAKQVKDAVDAVKAAQDSQKDQIKTLVEDTIRQIIKDHPGFTPERQLKFEDTPKGDTMEILPKELQHKSDEIFITSKLLGTRPQNLKSWPGFVRQMGDFKKALDTAASGGGTDWIPTGFSPAMFELIRLQLRVSALFPTVQMPTNPYKLPVQIGRFVSYKHSEGTADAGQTAISKGDYGQTITSAVTFTAVPHASEVLCSDEMTEDSIVPMMPFIQREIVTALAEGREDAILNSDTGTHEDTDTTSTASRRKMWLGLRASANDNSYTRDMSVMSLKNLRLLRGDMGKYGVMPSNLALVCGVKSYFKLLDIDEVVTLDKYGPQATVLAGELSKIDGIPVIVSEQVREDLNGSGIYELGQTRSAIYLINRNGFAVGERRPGDVKVLRELYAEYGQIAMLARERVDFEPIYAQASNRTINLGINVG